MKVHRNISTSVLGCCAKMRMRLRFAKGNFGIKIDFAFDAVVHDKFSCRLLQCSSDTYGIEAHLKSENTAILVQNTAMKCTLHESFGLHRVLRSTSKYFVLRVVCTLCTQSTSKYFCAQSLCTQSTSKYFCAQSTSKYVAKLQIATSSELYSLFMCTETSDQDNSRVGSPLESH